MSLAIRPCPEMPAAQLMRIFAFLPYSDHPRVACVSKLYLTVIQEYKKYWELQEVHLGCQYRRRSATDSPRELIREQLTIRAIQFNDFYATLTDEMKSRLPDLTVKTPYCSLENDPNQCILDDSKRIATVMVQIRNGKIEERSIQEQWFWSLAMHMDFFLLNKALQLGARPPESDLSHYTLLIERALEANDDLKACKLLNICSSLHDDPTLFTAYIDRKAENLILQAISHHMTLFIELVLGQISSVDLSFFLKIFEKAHQSHRKAPSQEIANLFFRRLFAQRQPLPLNARKNHFFFNYPYFMKWHCDLRWIEFLFSKEKRILVSNKKMGEIFISDCFKYRRSDIAHFFLKKFLYRDQNRKICIFHFESTHLNTAIRLGDLVGFDYLLEQDVRPDERSYNAAVRRGSLRFLNQLLTVFPCLRPDASSFAHALRSKNKKMISLHIPDPSDPDRRNHYTAFNLALKSESLALVQEILQKRIRPNHISCFETAFKTGNPALILTTITSGVSISAKIIEAAYVHLPATLDPDSRRNILHELHIRKI
jgi:hypothetical protein